MYIWIAYNKAELSILKMSKRGWIKRKGWVWEDAAHPFISCDQAINFKLCIWNYENGIKYTEEKKIV